MDTGTTAFPAGAPLPVISGLLFGNFLDWELPGAKIRALMLVEATALSVPIALEDCASPAVVRGGAGRPCAAASSDANPPVPRWPATGGAAEMAGNAETLPEMASRIGFTVAVVRRFRRARPGFMHSGNHVPACGAKSRRCANAFPFK